MYSRPLPGNGGRMRQFGSAPGGQSSLGRMMQPQQRQMGRSATSADAPPIGVPGPAEKTMMPAIEKPIDAGPPIDAPPPPPEGAPPMGQIGNLGSDINASNYLMRMGPALGGAFGFGQQPPQPPPVQQMPPQLAAAYGMAQAPQEPPQWAPASFPQPAQPGPMPGAGPDPQPGPMAGAPDTPAPAATPGMDGVSQTASRDPRKQQMNQMAAMQRGRQPAAY